MGLATFCACFILSALSVYAITDERNAQFRFNSRAVTPDVWPVFTLLSSGGFQGKRLLQPSGFSELELSFPQTLQAWDVLNRGTNFALNFMNSSWKGLAEANVYQRGEQMYLQASASAVPGHKLYIQSCYATLSPDPADESRYALILNRGCVSSKRSVIKFVSRQNDSINLLLNTSMLKFSQVYVHCSVVLSRYGKASDTKSCNYNKNTSRWVELGGQTGVCDCCASRCRGSPYSGGVLREFTVMVSTGPAAIVEHLQVTWPVIGASQVDNSASDSDKDWLVSGATPSSIERGWIVSETSVPGSLGRNELDSSPWQSQSELTDVMVMNQDLGDALSLWLPGLMVDIQSAPVFKLGAGSSQNKGREVDVPSLSNASTKHLLSDYEPVGEPLKMFSELQSPSQDPTGVVVEYVADMMDLRSDGLKYTDDSQEEELRGDVFMNFRPRSHLDASPKHVPLIHMDDVPKKVPEEPEGKDEVVVLTQTEVLLKRVKDVQLEPMRLSRLSLTQGLDGSSSLSYEEQPRSPNMFQEHGRKGVGEARLDQLGTEKLVASLLDLLMGLNKVVKSMPPV